MNQTAAGQGGVEYDPFAFGEIERSVPTTEAQREIWLAHRLSTAGSLAYSEAEELVLRGDLNVAALRQALCFQLQRHDALRSTVSGDGQHLVVSSAEGAARIALAGMDAPIAEGAAALLEARRRAVVTRWDLLNGPLFRAELVRVSEQEHVLFLSANHLVCDGWSWGVLLRDLAASYASLVQAGRLNEEQESDPFSEFAQEPEDSQAIADAMRYWTNQFADLPAPLELPLDHPRPARRSFTSAREDLVIPADLLGQLQQAATAQGCSLFSLMLSAFGLFLGRIAGQRDVVVGVPSAGQPWVGHPNMVGHCVHTLPIRLRQESAEAFASYLERGNDRLLDAIDHQSGTLSSILRAIRMRRDPSRVPLASVLFNIDSEQKNIFQAFPGLETTGKTIARVEDNFELSLNGVHTADGMRLECQYSTDLFNASTVHRWLSAYVNLLRGIAADPQGSIDVYALADAEALAELSALQPAVTDFPADRGMHQHFEVSCDKTPDAIAAVDANGSMRYAELDAEANRIAHLLRARDVQPGDLIGLAMDRGIPMLAAMLGILKAGAGYIPLDPAFPVARLQHMLDDGAPRMVVTESTHRDRLPLEGRAVIFLDEENTASRPDTRPQGVHVDPAAIAYVIYTSGSTGKPKGVEITHRSVANFLTSMREAPGMQADDVLVAVTTLSFDIAVLELLLPLTAGACVVIADKETAMDGQLLANLLQQEQATVLQATPATWHMLIDAGWQGHAGFRALCGGEAFPPQLAAQLLQRCGEVWNLYGPTETTVWSTRQRIGSAGPRAAIDINIGTPIANTQVWILDGNLNACLRGVPGELCIAGAGLARGYRNLPAMTADRFITWTGPQGPIRLYRTGDRACWRDDGRLEHMGRMDFQVKVRGYRIELGEIEARLVTHADIQDAVVIVREDDPGDVRIVAYVIPELGREPTAKELKAHLRNDLPDYMVPQHIVNLEAWPLTANGKIDRLALPSPLLQSGDPVAADHHLTPMQKDVLDAFRHALHQPTLAADDDFFMAGGHSLLAAQLTTQINKTLGTKLSLRAVFDAPTALRLAELAALEQPDAAGNADRPRPTGLTTAPVSANQAFHLLLNEFHANASALHLSSCHLLLGPLELGHFITAVDTMLQRQWALRTVYHRQDGDWVQTVCEAHITGLDEVVDLSHLPRERAIAVIQRDTVRMHALPMDIEKAPLLCTRMYRLAENEHVWFFMPHHLNFDGWSFDLLYNEMSEIYGALCEGREHRLPPLAVQTIDHAVWHADWLKGSEYASQRQHWKSVMAIPNARGGWPKALPTDAVATTDEVPHSPAVVFKLSGDRLASMRDAVRETAHTLNTVLSAALAATLGHMLHDGDVVIGLPVRGRNSVETEPLIGDFVNLLPVRVDLDGVGHLSSVVGRVRDSLLGAFSCPEIRLDDISHMRAFDPAAGKSPLYHAFLSYQDVRARPTQWGKLEHSRMLSLQHAVDDLSVEVIEEVECFTAIVHYNPALFSAATIHMFSARLKHAMERICDTPDMSLHALHAELDSIDPLPDTAQSQSTISYNPHNERAPMDSREQYVVDLWKKHLRVEVAPDDNFFDLGGTSMLALKMADELSRETGVKLRLPELAMQSAAQVALTLPQAKPVQAQSTPAANSGGGFFKRLFGSSGAA